MNTIYLVVITWAFLLAAFALSMNEARKARGKADTIWEFLMRRATVVAIHNEWGTFNSPFVPSEKGRALFTKLAPELRTFYIKLGRRLSENDLMLEIERRWGDRIVKEICIPANMSRGECLILAAHTAMDR